MPADLAGASAPWRAAPPPPTLPRSGELSESMAWGCWLCGEAGSPEDKVGKTWKVGGVRVKACARLCALTQRIPRRGVLLTSTSQV